MRSIFSTEYKQFVRQLIAARKNADLTQQDIATALKKPQSFVSKYERAERRLDVVEFLGIARIIGLDPSAFFRDLGKSTPKRSGG